jgi:hypothetical protein
MTLARMRFRLIAAGPHLYKATKPFIEVIQDARSNSVYYDLAQGF